MENISVTDLKTRLQSGEKINLVDVREPAEHAEFNIGGTLLPFGKIQTLQLDDIEPLKEQELVLYCRSGNRSMQAAMFLEIAGFNKVKNLAGGMVEWQKS